MTAAYRTSAAGGSTSGTSNRTVAITAALDDLIVVCGVFGANTNVAPTCTDDKGGLYTLVRAGLHNGSTDMHCMFVRNGPCGYAASHTITVATGSNTAGEVVAVAISGMLRFGTAAIRQSQLVQNQAGSSNPAASFTANCLTTNVTIGMVANATNPATLTPPTSWTERQDVGQATPNVGLEVVTRDSGFTTQNVGWGSATTLFGVIVLELDCSAAPTFPGVATSVQRLFNVAPTTGTETTPSVTTETSGSTILLGAARGTWANGSPTEPSDSKSNTFSAVASSPHPYTGFVASKTEVKSCTGATGGSSHAASLAWGAGSAGSGDEVTINLVEVDNVNTVQDSSWVDQPNLANTSTSNNVTTTGAAILVAYFWGYGDTGQLHAFRPQTDGFHRLDAACTDGDPVGAAGYIQCTVLWKSVAGAGTYNCVASGTAQEGAQIYLVALQQSAVSYTLTAGTGSLVETGTAAGLRIGHSTAPASGVIVETGTAATLRRGYTIAATSGSFTETGTAARLVTTRLIAPSLGAFAETGAAVGLRVGRSITASSISFAIIGTAASLRRGLALVAAAASLAVTGTAAGLTATHRIASGSASFSESGTPAALRRGSLLVAGVGALVLTGTDATLSASAADSVSLIVDAGAFAIGGTDARLVIGRRFAATGVSFAETGAAVGLSAGRRLAGLAGSLSETGTATMLVRGRSLLIGSGAVAFAGASVGLRVARTLALDASSFLETGTTARLSTGPVLSAEGDTVAIGGSAVGLRHGGRIIATSGDLALSGVATTLRTLRRLLATSGVFLDSASSGALVHGYPLALGSGAFALVGYSAILASIEGSPTLGGTLAETLELAAMLTTLELRAEIDEVIELRGTLSEIDRPPTG